VAAAPGEDPAESLLQTLAGLWRELPGLLNDRVELLSLELQRAGSALLQIVVLLVAAAILGVTTWLVLWAAIVAVLLLLGLQLPAALAVLLFSNAGAAWLVLRRVRVLLPRLRLTATRRHLMLSPSPEPDGPTEPETRDDRPEHFAAAGQTAAR
jgi:hypothetical protein